MRSSAVIVSYKPGDWLEDSISSALSQASEVVVVDNGSAEGRASRIASRLGAEPVRSETNIGFAGGVALGLRHIKGDLVGILNDDAVAGAQWISSAQRMLANPDVAAVTPKVILDRTFGEIVLGDEPWFAPGDPRPLGRQLKSVTVDGRDVLDELLGPGVYGVEKANGERWRWTSGERPFYVPLPGFAQGLREKPQAPRTETPRVELNGEIVKFTTVCNLVNHAGSFLDPYGLAGEFGFAAPDDGRFDEAAERFGFERDSPGFPQRDLAPPRFLRRGVLRVQRGHRLVSESASFGHACPLRARRNRGAPSFGDERRRERCVRSLPRRTKRDPLPVAKRAFVRRTQGVGPGGAGRCRPEGEQSGLRQAPVGGLLEDPNAATLGFDTDRGLGSLGRNRLDLGRRALSDRRARHQPPSGGRPLGYGRVGPRHQKSLVRRAFVLSALTATTASWALVAGFGAVHAAAVSAALDISTSWTQTLGDAGSPIALSSPNVASLPGGQAVVVGDRSGHVYAFYLNGGGTVPGWPYSTGGVPVDSTPSVAPINAGGLDTVFVGVGNASTPNEGGYQAISPQGGNQWFSNETNPSTDPVAHNGVQASMAVGSLQGGTDVVAGSLGEEEYAFNAANGGVLGGFPWYEADSMFSTAALADLYHSGQSDIVEGGDSSAGVSYGTHYSNGGHLRVLSPSGNAGQPVPNGGLVCDHDTDQTVQSSPAVGEFFGASQNVGIVFGTGATYSGASTTNHLIAVDSHCNPVWSAGLDGSTTSSPALADVLGNGQLQVVEGTNNGAGGGSVWALNGSNGAAIWHASASGEVIGSVVAADLTGQGYQDVIAPTTSGVEIFDGKSGQLVDTIGQGDGFQSSPLVTDDPNGSIGITVAGYNSSNKGVVTHYEITGSNGSNVNSAGSWPMFHHDPQLTGDAGTAINLEVPCSAPSSPQGYDMAASDGGIFNFGNQPFCGSTGAITLNKPVVGMAMTPDDGGYWMVASDGGIFNFGDAPYDGSMGGKPLNRPVVAMASTPSGKGYWMVASDGGVFTFGDATFYGSVPGVLRPGQQLNKPIVGMAATPDGRGYWMVASDGGIFAFGDAVYDGSMGGKPLNQPVVAMASTPAGNGYWMVASDGGIFTFGNAAYLGSMGGKPLNRPIVGMASTASGRGYWMVASDGGIFTFGDAGYYGSMGGKPLNRPVVAMAAPG